MTLALHRSTPAALAEWDARVSPTGNPTDPSVAVAGLILCRHRGRLSTVQSADRADSRAAHPGAPHLLRWRATRLELAGAAELVAYALRHRTGRLTARLSRDLARRRAGVRVRG